MMLDDIRFPVQPYPSQGRNGPINTAGINVRSFGQTVLLTPVNSRGHPSPACYIALPKDREVLRQLAHHILEIAA